jgi:tRNA (guanine37-N1)-methyltransferase
MVLKPEPLFAAVEAITSGEGIHIILLTPQGRLLCQEVVEELAVHERMLLICGHYEGVDERVRQHLVSDEVSIGDYVLSGGELAAMVMVDAVVRWLPGALGSEASVAEDSHSSGLLEYPQYTRPQVYRGCEVPPVLLSGNHAQIAKWRREQSILRTLRRRSDLLEKANLTDKEKGLTRGEGR